MSRPSRRNSHQPSDHEADDPVWSLLGRARLPAPSPTFSQRTLAAARRQQERDGPLRHWLISALHATRGRAFALSTLALALLASAGIWALLPARPDPVQAHRPSVPAVPSDTDADEAIQTLMAEVALIEDAERLLDPEDDMDLDDHDVDSLFF